MNVNFDYTPRGSEPSYDIGMKVNWRRRGFSLIELLIVISIILIIAAIAVPKMNRQLMLAREQAAIRQIGTIHQAETQHYRPFGRYALKSDRARSARQRRARTGRRRHHSASRSPIGKNTGYLFIVTGSPTGYSVNANPEAFGNSGGRCSFSDQTLVIRQSNTAEPANANSPEIK